ncbi:hypothetical protein ACFQ1E_20075 [Sphingomonas canadensis]|uniref:Uncharacterized protein n=1 Tax=Sphingomonas canadensis TaxID=1219257 RepID=A0ABW3HEI7_9SPHN|nr:hypothetical protein [Sphingomonas canadensis]MCW3838459.1 hypothetical protein [Sphingomonas canadensis]
MAGSILISDDSRVSTSTINLYEIVDSTRDTLKAMAPELIAPIYESMDVESMPFIRLDMLNSKDLMRFYEATKRARLHCDINPAWDRLIKEIEKDGRFIS